MKNNKTRSYFPLILLLGLCCAFPLLLLLGGGSILALITGFLTNNTFLLVLGLIVAVIVIALPFVRRKL